jgi:hypothetical protein
MIEPLRRAGLRRDEHRPAARLFDRRPRPDELDLFDASFATMNAIALPERSCPMSST